MESNVGEFGNLPCLTAMGNIVAMVQHVTDSRVLNEAWREKDWV